MPMFRSRLTYIEWSVTQQGTPFATQVDFLSGVPRLDAVLRYEDMPGCVAELPVLKAYNQLEAIPHNGWTSKGPKLSIRERDAILTHYRRDFEEYGYAIA
jgi:hypothetical protein